MSDKLTVGSIQFENAVSALETIEAYLGIKKERKIMRMLDELKGMEVSLRRKTTDKWANVRVTDFDDALDPPWLKCESENRIDWICLSSIDDIMLVVE